MKKIYRILFTVWLICMVNTMCVSAASKVKLDKTNILISSGRSCVIRVLGSTTAAAWKSSNKSIVSVDQTGKITAGKKGTAVITAKVGKKSYKCKVTVKQPVKSIQLNKKNAALIKGKKYTLKATVKPTNATVRSVTWTSSNRKVVKVSSSGAVTAVGTGEATVTATAKDGSGIKASCVFTVTAANVTKKTDTSAVKKTETAKNTETLAVKKTETTKNTETSAAKKTTEAVKTSPAGESALARRLLNILQGYSEQVQKDSGSNRVWKYSNSSAASTWKGSLDKMNANGVAYCNCALLVRWALRDMGIINSKNFWGDANGTIVFRGDVKEQLLRYCDIIEVYTTPSKLLAQGNLLPGDICTWVDYNHTNVYAGNGLWYDGGRSQAVGRYSASGDFVFRTFGPAATVNMSSTTIGYIIRLKK